MAGLMLRRLVVTLAAAAPRARALSHREAYIQKTRFIKNLKRARPACEATAEGCTPEQMERWAGIQ